jgi:hypothetical protein
MRITATPFLIALLAATASLYALAADPPLPPMVQRAQPGAGQRALQPLAGTWKVEKSLFVAIGTPDKPVRGENMTTKREWIGDGRFLHDVTQGSFNGQPYFRAGFLGYNNMDQRYEWVTADNFTPTLMAYQARSGSGPNATGQPIDMKGQFTDLGITGEQNVGKNVPMRTVVRIENENRHVFEIYFTPPGGTEVLADRMVFTRVAP